MTFEIPGRALRSLDAHLERRERRVLESDRAQKRSELGVLLLHQRAYGGGALLLQVLDHGFEETPSDRAALVIRIHAEALDPAARLLEAEFTAAQVREHEPDDLAPHLRHLARVGIPSQVIHDPPLPHVRPVDPRKAFVDRDDGRDIEFGKGADADLLGDRAHGLSVSHWGAGRPVTGPTAPFTSSTGGDPTWRLPTRRRAPGRAPSRRHARPAT